MSSLDSWQFNPCASLNRCDVLGKGMMGGRGKGGHWVAEQQLAVQPLRLTQV